MNECMSEEMLAEAGHLLASADEQSLAHLSRCERCRASVVDLASLGSALAGEVDLRPGRIDQIMRALAEEGLGEEAEHPVTRPKNWLFGAAGAAAVMAILVQAGAPLQGAPPPSAPATLVLSIVGTMMVGLAFRLIPGQRRS